MVKDHSDSERENPLPTQGCVFLYASSHTQDNTYHGLCYISRGALAGTRNRVKTKTTSSARKKTYVFYFDCQFLDFCGQFVLRFLQIAASST